MPPSSMKELVATNLHYFGEKKLSALEDTQLEELAELMSTGGKAPIPSSKSDRIAFILERKRARAAAARAPSPLAPAAKVEAPAPAAPVEVFKKQHKIRVAAFNALKLRINFVGLELHWMLLIKAFAQFDVLLVSEVPAEPSVKKIEDKRSFGVKTMLNKFSHEHAGKGEDDPIEDLWMMVLSEPSGPGNKEVHAIYVKKPIQILQHKTRTNFKAGDVTLDHAPLTIAVYDDRFECTDDRTWCFTSVHFPPRDRKDARDKQLKAFFETYSREADFRGGTPFTEKGARDAMQSVVNHVTAGDFNDHPSKYASEADGYAPPLLSERIATTAGGNAYDNFVVSKHVVDKFALNPHTLELISYHDPASDEKGVSDHSPILLSVMEQPRVKSSTCKKTDTPPTTTTTKQQTE